jgi:hypothetical protein
MRSTIIAVLALAGCPGDPPTGQPPGGGDDAAQADSPVGGEDADLPNTTTFSFFISSTGIPTGGDFRRTPADLDGLAGADEFCTTKAVAAVPEASTRVWRAYFSTDAIDARDRIGVGPWFNVNNVMIATSVANLVDAAANNVTKLTALDETGATVNGTGDTPVQHDILTGSNADGTKSVNTCANWTSSAPTGTLAQVGHHDRMGGGADPTSWSSAHASSGCSADAFVGTGGRGSIFCFASD